MKELRGPSAFAFFCVLSLLMISLGLGFPLYAEENPDKEIEDSDKIENLDLMGQEEKDAALLAELRKGNVSRVEALLKAGADPNRPDQEGRTAAWIAVDMYLKTGELLGILADAGLRFDTLSRRGITPLFQAVEGGGRGSGAFLFILNWEEKNSPGFTGGKTSRSAYLSFVLGEVCRRPGHEEEAAALFAAGADLSAFVSSGDEGTVLSKSPARSYYLLFIRQGLSVDIQDRQGATFLMEAVDYGDEDLAKALLEAGADPNIRNTRGRSALMKARGIPMIRLLLDRGADAAALDMYGRGLVYYAYPRNTDVFRMLIDAGAGLDHPDNEGYTPLMLAAMDRGPSRDAQANEQHITALLDLGADPLKRGPKGETLLLLYLRADWYDTASTALVQRLLDAGIDPAEADDSGNSPLSVILKDKSHRDPSGIRRIVMAGTDRKTLSAAKSRIRRERREEFAGEIPGNLFVSALYLPLPAYVGLSVWTREGLYRDTGEKNWMAPFNAALTGFASGTALTFFLFAQSQGLDWGTKITGCLIIAPLVGVLTGGVFAGVPRIREAFAHNPILYYLPSAAAGTLFTIGL
ncbi:MAG: hypothetical protein LBP60_02985, partial [Spirochaetaceae bacterium]|nr:hypothetical protein [Spirochaetaceae bacterium]